MRKNLMKKRLFTLFSVLAFGLGVYAQSFQLKYHTWEVGSNGNESYVCKDDGTVDTIATNQNVIVVPYSTTSIWINGSYTEGETTTNIAITKRRLTNTGLDSVKIGDNTNLYVYVKRVNPKLNVTINRKTIVVDSFITTFTDTVTTPKVSLVATQEGTDTIKWVNTIDGWESSIGLSSDTVVYLDEGTDTIQLVGYNKLGESFRLDFNIYWDKKKWLEENLKLKEIILTSENDTVKGLNALTIKTDNKYDVTGIPVNDLVTVTVKPSDVQRNKPTRYHYQDTVAFVLSYIPEGEVVAVGDSVHDTAYVVYPSKITAFELEVVESFKSDTAKNGDITYRVIGERANVVLTSPVTLNIPENEHKYYTVTYPEDVESIKGDTSYFILKSGPNKFTYQVKNELGTDSATKNIIINSYVDDIDFDLILDSTKIEGVVKHNSENGYVDSITLADGISDAKSVIKDEPVLKNPDVSKITEYAPAGQKLLEPDETIIFTYKSSSLASVKTLTKKYVVRRQSNNVSIKDIPDTLYFDGDIFHLNFTNGEFSFNSELFEPEDDRTKVVLYPGSGKVTITPEDDTFKRDYKYEGFVFEPDSVKILIKGEESNLKYNKIDSIFEVSLLDPYALVAEDFTDGNGEYIIENFTYEKLQNLNGGEGEGEFTATKYNFSQSYKFTVVKGSGKGGEMGIKKVDSSKGYTVISANGRVIATHVSAQKAQELFRTYKLVKIIPSR